MSRQADQHVDVGLEQARHQQVSGEPDKLAEGQLPSRKSLVGRLAGCGAPELEHEGQSEVIVGVETGDGVEEVLQVLAGKRDRVDDALVLVDQLVAGTLVGTVAELLNLLENMKECNSCPFDHSCSIPTCERSLCTVEAKVRSGR